MELFVLKLLRCKRRNFQALTKLVGGMSADAFQATSLKDSRLQMTHHSIVLSGSERKLLLSKTASTSSPNRIKAAAFSCCAF